MLAAHISGDQIMGIPYFIKATRACAVCTYWNGNRSRFRAGMAVDSESSLGLCQNRKSNKYGENTTAGKNNCPECVTLSNLE